MLLPVLIAVILGTQPALPAGRGPDQETARSTPPSSPETIERLLHRRNNAVLEQAGLGAAGTRITLVDHNDSESPFLASYQWQVDGYARRTERRLDSQVFRVAATLWQLILYPQGDEDHQGYVGLYIGATLASHWSPKEAVFMEWNFSLLSAQGSPPPITQEASHNFTRFSTNWGTHKLLQRSALLDLSKGLLDHQGNLLLRVDVRQVTPHWVDYAGIERQHYDTVRSSVALWREMQGLGVKDLHVTYSVTDDGHSKVGYNLRGQFYRSADELRAALSAQSDTLRSYFSAAGGAPTGSRPLGAGAAGSGGALAVVATAADDPTGVLRGLWRQWQGGSDGVDGGAEERYVRAAAAAAVWLAAALVLVAVVLLAQRWYLAAQAPNAAQRSTQAKSGTSSKPGLRQQQRPAKKQQQQQPLARASQQRDGASTAAAGTASPPAVSAATQAPTAAFKVAPLPSSAAPEPASGNTQAADAAAVQSVPSAGPRTGQTKPRSASVVGAAGAQPQAPSQGPRAAAAKSVSAPQAPAGTGDGKAQHAAQSAPASTAAQVVTPSPGLLLEQTRAAGTSVVGPAAPTQGPAAAPVRERASSRPLPAIAGEGPGAAAAACAHQKALQPPLRSEAADRRQPGGAAAGSGPARPQVAAAGAAAQRQEQPSSLRPSSGSAGGVVQHQASAQQPAVGQAVPAPERLGPPGGGGLGTAQSGAGAGAAGELPAPQRRSGVPAPVAWLQALRRRGLKRAALALTAVARYLLAVAVILTEESEGGAGYAQEAAAETPVTVTAPAAVEPTPPPPPQQRLLQSTPQASPQQQQQQQRPEAVDAAPAGTTQQDSPPRKPRTVIAEQGTLVPTAPAGGAGVEQPRPGAGSSGGSSSNGGSSSKPAARKRLPVAVVSDSSGRSSPDKPPPPAAATSPLAAAAGAGTNGTASATAGAHSSPDLPELERTAAAAAVPDAAPVAAAGTPWVGPGQPSGASGASGAVGPGPWLVAAPGAYAQGVGEETAVLNQPPLVPSSGIWGPIQHPAPPQPSPPHPQQQPHAHPDQHLSHAHPQAWRPYGLWSSGLWSAPTTAPQLVHHVPTVADPQAQLLVTAPPGGALVPPPHPGVRAPGAGVRPSGLLTNGAAAAGAGVGAAAAAACQVCLQQPQECGFVHADCVHAGVCAACAAQAMRQERPTCPLCGRACSRVVALAQHGVVA